MATYTLQSAALGGVSLTGSGVFTLSFPIDTDVNMPAPYAPVVGDVIQLGWIPKGFIALRGWLDGAMSSGSSTWFFGDGGASNRLSGPNDVTVSTVGGARATFLQTPALPIFYGTLAIPVTTLIPRALFTMTCNVVSGSGSLRGVVSLRGYMDDPNATTDPITGVPQF